MAGIWAGKVMMDLILVSNKFLIVLVLCMVCDWHLARLTLE